MKINIHVLILAFISGIIPQDLWATKCVQIFSEGEKAIEISNTGAGNVKHKWEFPKQRFDYGSFEAYYKNTIQVRPSQPRGLQRIAKAAEEKGLTLVYDIDVTDMTPKEIGELKVLLGEGTPIGTSAKHQIRVVIVDQLGLRNRLDGVPDPFYSQGVVLHIGVEPLLSTVFRSIDPDLNISMGYGDYHGRYDNKVREANDISEIDPAVMGKSISGDFYLRGMTSKDGVSAGSPASAQSANPELVKEINSLRSKAKADLEKLSTARQLKTNPKQLTAELELLVLKFIELTRQTQGDAFLKFAFESGTGDFALMVTNFVKDPKKLAKRIVRQYLSDIRQIRADTMSILKREKAIHKDLKSQIPDRLSFEDPAFQALLREQDQGFTNFLNALILRPEQILVQSKVGIVKLPSEHIAEYRVHFLDGEVVQVIPRNGYDHVPMYEEIAKRRIEEFFKAAPMEFRYLMGGADVMIGPDGTSKVIEFNFGASSGFMDALNYPFLGNEFVLRIAQGSDFRASSQGTVLLREFKTLVDAALEKGDTSGLISRLKATYKSAWGEEATLEKYNIKEISDDEALAWVTRQFSSRLLDYIQKGASLESISKEHLRLKTLLEKVFKGLTKSQQGTEELQEIYRTAILSMERMVDRTMDRGLR